MVFRTLTEAPVVSSSAPQADLGDQGETAELWVFGVFCTMPSHPPSPAAEVAELSTVQCSVEEELAPFRKIVGTVGKDSNSLPDMPAFSQHIVAQQ